MMWQLVAARAEVLASGPASMPPYEPALAPMLASMLRPLLEREASVLTSKQAWIPW